MQRIKHYLGVTLLEIMLVLAIAAIIVVLSIQYYQSAQLGTRVNQAISAITGVMSGADSYQSGRGSYSGLGNSNVQAYMPGGTMVGSPWGGTITVTGSANSYGIIMENVPGAACTQLNNNLSANKYITVPTCAATTTAAYSLSISSTPHS